MRGKVIYGVLALAGAGVLTHGANGKEQETGAFTLGAVVVSATPLDEKPVGGSSIDRGKIRTHDRETVGGALNLASGVALSKVGARNEEMVYVRGFDLRQVPVFVDGIPVYVPYDGYVDLGRFTTYDLARIDVAKGFSSLIYGPNTLGGAINLISRRPSETLEGEVGIGSAWTRDGDNSSNRVYANVGSNQGSWYLQASASYLDSNYFQLPGDFEATRFEDGGHRNNSYNTDRKYNLKLGLTPNETDEYSLNYISQHGEKGNPPYAGTVSTINARYWQWPYWDKDSLYYISSTQFGKATLKLRAYHDTYENALYTYDDATYSTQDRPSSFRSYYDDYTNGASVQLDLQLGERNLLKGAYHWKEDVHREHNAGEPERGVEDRTQSLALENSYQITDALSVVAGVSHDWRETLKAEDYNSTTGTISSHDRDDNSVNNAALGLYWQLREGGTVYSTVARKSRFATIKDRYSYRFGTALPNPGLDTEHATHYEIGFESDTDGVWQWNVALFHSDVTDMIQSVRIPASACSSPPCSQMQNIGEVRINGIDTGVHASFERWQLGLTYSYLDRENLSDPTVELIDTPKHKVVGDLTWKISDPWSVTASAEASSSRYSSSDGLQQTSGFGIANLKSGYRLFDQTLLIEAGVRNLLDRLYEYSEGFPEPGRTWFVQINQQF